MARSTWLLSLTMRCSSGRDVPGLVRMCDRKSCSLKVGKSDSPSRGTMAMPSTASTASTP